MSNIVDKIAALSPRTAQILAIVITLFLMTIAGFVMLNNSTSENPLITEPFPFEPDIFNEPGIAISDSFYNALSLYNLGLYVEAIEVFLPIIEVDSTYMPTYFFCGISCLMAQQFDIAVDLLEKVAKQQPDFEPGMWYLAHAYLRFGRVEEAIGIFNILSKDSEYSTQSKKILAVFSSVTP